MKRKMAILFLAMFLMAGMATGGYCEESQDPQAGQNKKAAQVQTVVQPNWVAVMYAVMNAVSIAW